MTTLEIPSRVTESRHFMDTMITIEVESWVPRKRIERAFDWFAEVESRCSRFDAESELRRLCLRYGQTVAVSELLFGAIAFAVQVAEASGGAFDPTVGRAMQVAGFDRNYLTGREWQDYAADRKATYKDILLNAQKSTITLQRPLVLDLGAVAKGLAIDLASEELQDVDYCINAGGDIRCAGLGEGDKPWRVGVRHPRQRGLLDVIEVGNSAVCTSGDYERPGLDGRGHIIKKQAGNDESDIRVASATVIAPSAMAADALSTAAFVMGPRRGLAMLHEQGVEAMLVTTALGIYETPGFDALRV